MSSLSATIVRHSLSIMGASSSSDLPRGSRAKRQVPILPPELQFLILEHVGDRRAKDPRTLYACSLVCSAWAVFTKSMLFSDVTLQAAPTTRDFLSVIRGKPTLGCMLRVLDIQLSVVTHPAGMKLARSICSECPCLYRLIIHIPAGFSAYDLLHPFAPHTRATLKALNLVQSSRGNTTDAFDILKLVRQFSNLSHLSLIGFVDFVPIGVANLQHTSFAAFKLYEFNWKPDRSVGLDWQVSALRYILPWLFGPGGSSELRILDIGKQVDFETRVAIFDFIELSGSKLHSLRWWIKEADLLQAKSPLLMICPELRELVLPACSLSEEIRDILPIDNLEHLDFAEAESDDWDSIVETILWILSLPKIRHVTFRTAWNETEAPWADLSFWQMCTSVGIYVEILSAKNHRKMPLEDPIISSHFPRGLYAKNLKHMNNLDFPGTKPNALSWKQVTDR